MKKILLSILILLFVAVTALLCFVKFMLPSVGDAPEITINASPEMLQRGKYLAHNVCVCIDCHSERDWKLFSAPPVNGTWGKGGELFSEKFGFPGNYYAPNITPAALSSWTDGEIYRAITCGVNKNGKALFPIMPYPCYGKLDENDLQSIIAYIRTLAPITSQVPASSSNFPMNFIINTIPAKPAPATKPDTSDVLAYGAYLVNAAGCTECHTKQEKGQKIAGMEFAGGFEFPLPTGGTVRSRNITPHATGIGGWTKEQFVKKFKSFADSATAPAPVEPGNFNTVMPWTMYAGISEKDLVAMYEYLRSVPAVENKVVMFTK